MSELKLKTTQDGRRLMIELAARTTQPAPLVGLCRDIVADFGLVQAELRKTQAQAAAMRKRVGPHADSCDFCCSLCPADVHGDPGDMSCDCWVSKFLAGNNAGRELQARLKRLEVVAEAANRNDVNAADWVRHGCDGSGPVNADGSCIACANERDLHEKLAALDAGAEGGG